ncbi:hypothetical protein LSTR_LSTR012543 [Laodelphax striatellus]|uniref:Uncharacterized protein n=1 Tax=Laodelphax striatellus TaxID=195883 RepID=A0A482XLZ4_LAOST|nr:hypothetical protein LSTR_LSTR012543 [Laodelphax striatellus]
MPEDNVQDDNNKAGQRCVCLCVSVTLKVAARGAGVCDLRAAPRRALHALLLVSIPGQLTLACAQGRCARPWFAFTAYKVSSAFCGVAPAAQHASRLPLPQTDHLLLHAVNYNRLGCCSTQSILVKCGGEAGFGSQGWGEGRAPWSSDRRPPPAASQPQHQHGAGGPALSPSSLRQDGGAGAGNARL